MIGLPNTSVTQKNAKDHPAANTEAEVEIAAVADSAIGGHKTIHVLKWIHFSFDAASGAVETLTVAIGGTTVWQIDIPNAAIVDFISFGKGMYSVNGNEALVVTLSASAGGAKGKVNIGYE